MRPVHALTISLLICLWVPADGRAEEGDTLIKVSNEFCNALIFGQADQIKKRIASFEEMSSVSNRVTDEKEYLQAVDEWVKKMAGEFKEARKRGPVAYGGAEIKDAMIFYPDNDKIKQTGVLAIVQPAFTIDGKLQEGFVPLFFVQIGRHWKVTIKK